MAAFDEVTRMSVCVTSLVALIFIEQCRGQLFEPTYIINEELPEDSVVGDVGRDSNISHLLSVEDYKSLSYRLLPLSQSVINLFTIGNTTGVLKTAARIDREALCRFDPQCKLVLSAAAQSESGQQFYTIKIYVIIRDINDHHPQFPQLIWPVNIYEDAAEFTSIPIIAATDPDILNNTIQTYTLKPNSDTFELKVSRNLDDSLVPQLFVKAPLNREARPFYLLKVVAMDGGSPRRSGELTVNVSVLDVNDNPPRFSQQTYDVSVEEDKPIGYRVITLSATDDDIGANGRVKFQLGARQNEEAFNTFRVVPESGYIVTLRDLTALQGETMKLVVEAVDGGAKSLTAQAMVNIHILDSINNAPTIRLTIPYGQRVTTITENAAPGLVVAHFIVDDPDSGENGVVTCHLHDDTFGLQRLKEAEYKVTVYSVLDRERVPFYDVTVTCSDGGHPPMSTNIAFSVILDDANDNPPRFLRSLYLANVTENNPGGFVLKVEAEDSDVGQNGKVTYRLGNVTSLVASYIHVNSTTGDVKTKQMLDHELFRELDFYVVAMDDGTPSMSSSARIIISVIDENDNRPKVPSDFYLSIGENLPPGSLVGYINAIDPDKGPAGEVGYQLLGKDYTGMFDVSETGEVRALVSFDRELRDVYDITVLARDFGAQPLDNVLGIRIIVTDANDHYPQFQFPTKNNRTAHTTIDSRFNATVAHVSATDLDLGKNGTLTYTITSHDKFFFEIDPQTGRIFVTRQLYGPDKGTYDIHLFVRDNGFPTLSNTSTLTVIVTQGNTTAIFSTFGYHEQMIIVAVLVAFTVSIAVVVFLIVLRFVKKDRRDRRPKYTSGLPMEIKKRSPTPEDDASSDEGPWRRYDEAKRPNGPVVTSGDVSYDANDDIIMFKLKLADQYRELEPEDKDHHGGALACSDTGSNRNSFNSDVDGAPDVTRDRHITRLATFQANLPMLQVSTMSTNCDSKDKVWRSPPKEKMADEILSSSSRETTGADSGRGPSEDGSQSRSSITDDSGCLISPSHSILRGNTSKGQGNFSRPPSGSGFDRPPLLMTFQSTSEMTSTNGAANGGSGAGSNTYGSRKEYGGNPTSPRQMNYYSTKSGDKMKHFDKDTVGTRTYSETGSDKDRYKENTLKKVIDDGYVSNGSSSQKSFTHHNGFKKSNERLTTPTNKGRDSRLCSEPPVSGNKGSTSPSYNTPVQETGLTPSPSPVSPSMMYMTSSRPLIPRSADTTLRSDHSQFKYPPSPSYLQTSSPSPHSFKQASCPQLYKNGSSLHDPHSQSTLPSSNRSRMFNTHESTFTAPSRSMQDIFNESLEGQEDSNTTTTSGSYTIDQEELTVDLPPTDVFV